MATIEPRNYTDDQLKHVVRAPSGPCPIPFTTFWDSRSLPLDVTICSWFWEVRNYGLRRGEFFTAEAIANWSSTFFDMTTPEFDHVRGVILEYAEAIGDHGFDEQAKS